MMFLTEEEAKLKWCPMLHKAVVQLIEAGKLSRATETDAKFLCIASDCMFWRWQSSLTINNPQRKPGFGQKIEQERGYCGLAGRA